MRPLTPDAAVPRSPVLKKRVPPEALVLRSTPATGEVVAGGEDVCRPATALPGVRPRGAGWVRGPVAMGISITLTAAACAPA